MTKHFNLKILSLAFPLMLAHITIPLLGLVNTIVVGHLPHYYFLGAIGLGGMIFNFIYWGVGFLRMSTTGLIAKAQGEGDHPQAERIITHSLLLAILIALLLLVLQVPIEKTAFLLIHGSQKVRFYTQQYYFMRIWGAPAVLMNYVLIGAFIGLRRTKSALVTVAITNFVAIILNFILVFQFKMTVNGVALADVIAQYAGCFVGFLLLRQHLQWTFKRRWFELHGALVKKLFSANRDIFIRTLCLVMIFSFFTAHSSSLGIVVLATNTVLLNFFMFASYALDSFAGVAEGLIGHAVGAKDLSACKKVIYDCAFWSVLTAGLFSVVYAFLGIPLIHLMTGLFDVQVAAKQLLWLVVLLPLITVLSFLMDGIFIGLNQFHLMRNAMLLAFVGFFVIWYLLIPFANIGLWVAFLSFFVLRALIMGIILQRSLSRWLLFD